MQTTTDQKVDLYYADMTAYTDKFDLTDEQRKNANVNEPLLRQRIRELTNEIAVLTAERDLLKGNDLYKQCASVIKTLQAIHDDELDQTTSPTKKKMKVKLQNDEATLQADVSNFYKKYSNCSYPYDAARQTGMRNFFIEPY